MYIKNINSNEGCLPHEAIERITALGLNKINEDIYRSFINSITAYPNGLKVKLNTGIEGIVIKQNKNMPARPVVAVKDNGAFKYINLEQELNIIIEDVVL